MELKSNSVNNVAPRPSVTVSHRNLLQLTMFGLSLNILNEKPHTWIKDDLDTC